MEALLAAAFVVAAWWGGTGLVLLLDGRPRATHRASIAGATVLALLGAAGLYWSSRHASVLAACLGFASALAVWAWHELLFLMGVVTGPRRVPCPPDARGWRRFAYGVEVVLHHELALAWTLIAVFTLTRGAPNQVGTATFLVLWVMRLSAKLNIFLGVRNLTTEFIPAHLNYLLSYFRRARFNPLMPVSVILGMVALIKIIIRAADGDASLFLRVGHTLVATLLAMALLEHLFLALPIPDAWLWRWAMRPGHGPAGQGERA